MHNNYIALSGVQSIVISAYVCLSECAQSYLKNYMYKFHEIFCTCYPWSTSFVDHVTFSHKGSHRAVIKDNVMSVKFARWQHWGKVAVCDYRLVGVIVNYLPPVTSRPPTA